MTERKIKRKNMERTTDQEDNRVESLSKMINASRAFRNLPPEMTMGKEYDGKRDAKRGRDKLTIE